MIDVEGAMCDRLLSDLGVNLDVLRLALGRDAG